MERGTVRVSASEAKGQDWEAVEVAVGIWV